MNDMLERLSHERRPYGAPPARW